MIKKRVLLFSILMLILFLFTACDKMTAEQRNAYESLLQQAGRASQAPQEAEVLYERCDDSDGGKNIHDFGTTTTFMQGKYFTNKDKCSGNILYEALCKAHETHFTEAINCEQYNMICKNGACVINPEVMEQQQCYDSDEGVNMLEYGITTEKINEEIITNEDKCIGNILYERVCKQGKTEAVERIDCTDFGLICVNGICIREPEEDIEEEGEGEDDAPEDNAPLGGGGPVIIPAPVPVPLPGLPRQALPAGSGPLPVLEPNCIDTDGNDISVKGTASVNARRYIDSCQDQETLFEYYCTGGNYISSTRGERVTSQLFDCSSRGMVCRQGACVMPDPPRFTPIPPQSSQDSRAGTVSTVESQITVRCIDLDNGVDTARAAKAVVDYRDGTTKQWTDSCDNNEPNLLLEQACVNGQTRQVHHIDCEEQGKVCKQGACVNPVSFEEITPQYSCVDSDGGRNSAVKGEAIQRRPNEDVGAFRDYCKDENILMEAICEGKRGKFIEISCEAEGKKCNTGRCIKLLSVTKIETPGITQQYPILKDIKVRKIL
ncbi:hypothetical protein KY304_01250 [Candidatus Woesearchaeota archaeon]|nr:hypothetical protein [Candidatus Woesearchaeota archaeon]